jgi:hypothetical protein
VERLYTALSFEVYHAPFTATDFLAPTIWAVEAVEAGEEVAFRVQVEDESGTVSRVVMLYREGDETVWSKAELVYNPGTGWATGSVPAPSGTFYYFAQAVDGTGNVTLALDHGRAYTGLSAEDHKVYLPVVIKNGQ